MEQVRDKSIDAMKGFAILLVMLGHCIVLNHMEDGYLYDAIAAVQMPLFIVVSGYLAGGAAPIIDINQLGQRLLKRAVTYLVPFFVWIFVLHPTTFLERVRLVLFQLDLGLWFLMVLFLMTAAVSIAEWAKNATPLGTFGFYGVLGIFLVLFLWQYVSGSRFLSPHLMVKYLPFFFLGYGIGRWRTQRQTENKERAASKPVLYGSLCLTGVIFGYLVVCFDLVTAHDRTEWLLQMLASLCGVFLCGWGIYRLKSGRLKRILANLGRYTLEIYVLHFHFATILGMDQAGLVLYSRKGMCVVIGTFLLMSVLTAFFIFTFRKLWITNFLLFGKWKH